MEELCRNSFFVGLTGVAIGYTVMTIALFAAGALPRVKQNDYFIYTQTKDGLISYRTQKWSSLTEALEHYDIDPQVPPTELMGWPTPAALFDKNHRVGVGIDIGSNQFGRPIYPNKRR